MEEAMADSPYLQLLLCPSTGQLCVKKTPVFDRSITLKRWTGGNIKATVCSLACAERWATDKGYVVTGESSVHEREKTTTVVIVQHPDQVHSSIKTSKKKI